MAEYIEREAFKSKYLCCGYLPEMSEAEFDSFPAADVELVVRCKDCKHWMEAALACNHPDRKHSFERYFTPDCFCSFGERRVDGAKSGSLTYMGAARTPSWNNYDSTQLEIGGTTSATAAGSYDATFTPKANYCWPEGDGA